MASLAKPRTAIIMVQAGKGTDAVIDQLLERFEPGDIIVDGGNANFHDTIACEARIAPTDGAGHFVKMIHNGIEYADMELIGEAYDLLRNVAGYEPTKIADIFAEWNKGPLSSYLIEITAEILRHVDAETGKPSPPPRPPCRCRASRPR